MTKQEIEIIKLLIDKNSSTESCGQFDREIRVFMSKRGMEQLKKEIEVLQDEK